MDKKADFELFKKEFVKYQKLFGLMGYKVLFFHKPLKDSNSEIYVDPQNMAAKIALTTLTYKNDDGWDVKRIAKREAIHLLLGRLSDYGHRRDMSHELLNEAKRK